VTVKGPSHDLIADLARQLVGPLHSLRDHLGLVVDQIERHVSGSTGPNPYPWRSLQALRQDLGNAYLEATTVAKRFAELEIALAPSDTIDWFDATATVDLALRLANYRLGPNVEQLFDLGGTPHARGIGGTFALVVAQLVTACAESASATEGSTLTVRTTFDPAGYVVILVADNGAGSTRAGVLGGLARDLFAPWGGMCEAAVETGQGCTFEIRLIARPE